MTSQNRQQQVWFGNSTVNPAVERHHRRATDIAPPVRREHAGPVTAIPAQDSNVQPRVWFGNSTVNPAVERHHRRSALPALPVQAAAETSPE